MHEQVVHNKRMTFQDEGAGDVLLLLHAFPLSSAMWRRQLEDLRGGYRVIAPDLPGFGGTEPCAPHASPMDKMAEDVLALIDQLRVTRAVVAGCSMGGYVALQLAQKRPKLVRGLVLSNSRASADGNEARIGREKAASNLLKRGVVELEENNLPKLLGPHASPAVKAEVLSMIRAASPQGAAAASRGMGMRADSNAFLASFATPVLVIHGEDDVVIKQDECEELTKVALRGRLHIIPRAGHLTPMEQPEAWSSAVTEWMNELPR